MCVAKADEMPAIRLCFPPQMRPSRIDNPFHSRYNWYNNSQQALKGINRVVSRHQRGRPLGCKAFCGEYTACRPGARCEEQRVPRVKGMERCFLHNLGGTAEWSVPICTKGVFLLRSGESNKAKPSVTPQMKEMHAPTGNTQLPTIVYFSENLRLRCCKWNGPG